LNSNADLRVLTHPLPRVVLTSYHRTTPATGLEALAYRRLVIRPET
jgi:hypothetical protein